MNKNPLNNEAPITIIYVKQDIGHDCDILFKAAVGKILRSFLHVELGKLLFQHRIQLKMLVPQINFVLPGVFFLEWNVWKRINMKT